MQVVPDEAVAPPVDNTQVQQARAELDAIKPPIETRVLELRLISPAGQPHPYRFVQDQLGMFPVQEFVTMMAEVIDEFATGDSGMKIGELLRGEVARPDQINAETVDSLVEDNIVLIKAFLKLLHIMPELQKDIIALALGVDTDQRDWFKEAISRAPAYGGLTLDEGTDIIIWFIRQNSELVRRFLAEKGRELVDEFRLHVLGETPDVEGEATTVETTTEPVSTPGSTPSSTSSPATPVSV